MKNNLNYIKKDKKRLDVEDLMDKKEEYLKLKKNVKDTPLKKSIEIIIDQINLDVVNILKYNRI